MGGRLGLKEPERSVSFIDILLASHVKSKSDFCWNPMSHFNFQLSGFAYQTELRSPRSSGSHPHLSPQTMVPPLRDHITTSLT